MLLDSEGFLGVEYENYKVGLPSSYPMLQRWRIGLKDRTNGNGGFVDGFEVFASFVEGMKGYSSSVRVYQRVR